MSTEVFGTNQWKLRRQPLVLSDPKQVTPSTLVKDKNLRILIPAFSTTYAGWPGSSYVVARVIITLDESWSIITPVLYPTEFNACAVIRWVAVDDTVQRYKLWEDVSEVLAYPLYAGEPIPAGTVALEFWCVNDGLSTMTLPEDWYLETSKLTLPSNYNDTTLSVLTQSSAICETGSETTLAGLFSKCV